MTVVVDTRTGRRSSTMGATRCSKMPASSSLDHGRAEPEDRHFRAVEGDQRVGDAVDPKGCHQVFERGNTGPALIGYPRAQRCSDQSARSHRHVGDLGQGIKPSENQTMTNTCGGYGAGHRHAGVKRETREPQGLGESSLVCHGPPFLRHRHGCASPRPKRKGEVTAPRPEENSGGKWWFCDFLQSVHLTAEEGGNVDLGLIDIQRVDPRWCVERLVSAAADPGRSGLGLRPARVRRARRQAGQAGRNRSRERGVPLFGFMHILRGRGLGKTATGEALEEPESAACRAVWSASDGASARFHCGLVLPSRRRGRPVHQGFEQLRLGGCYGWC